MQYKNSNRRDDNEPEIRVEFAARGWETWQLPPGSGADMLAFGHGRFEIVEVKNPAGDGRLTEKERELQRICRFFGVRYNIICRTAQVRELTGDVEPEVKGR